MADQWDYYEWVVGRPARSPVIERGFAWLEDRTGPTTRATPCSAGATRRIGNMLYRDFTPVAVLDWEMAGLAPREIDLAWMVFLHRFFEDLATQLELPGMPDFLRLDDVAADLRAGQRPHARATSTSS